MATSAQAAYATTTVPLSSITDGTRIAKVGNAKVAFVGVLDAPAGVSVSLKFGPGGDAVPLTDRWTGIEFDPPHDQGIYYVVPAVQAGEVTLLIGYYQPC